jgi:hypothetical protein
MKKKRERKRREDIILNEKAFFFFFYLFISSYSQNEYEKLMIFYIEFLSSLFVLCFITEP